VPNAVRYDVEVTNFLPVDLGNGCVSQGAVLGSEPVLSVTAPSASLRPKFADARGYAFSIWSVTAVGACGQRSPKSSLLIITYQDDNLASGDGGAELPSVSEQDPDAPIGSALGP
jgi:hypothetical protein